MRGKVVAGVETLRATSLPGGGRNKKSVVLQRKSKKKKKQREYCISYIYKIGCIKDIK